ncbi:Ni/Fe-hydrogenase cytochrome b subunit [Azospirillum brasilense]|uniref:Ni/Fe-hydrogenase cytochrome b subunit n=1 Tax=Azospirillum brasilense TaxID=192 RepID=A0A0P0F9G5_AZOBR|nr:MULTISPECIES: Ni/Fe-hydrogenase cytochrome b subunit [Azospirillum]ALJ37581.1 hydrogenase [Azospirillum brasilense]MDW7553786.1 Ni/Fe-hydrogenase cytochrome b subunit [Azospirillum brasilense]MDW7592775.1 Ni/Fe-hydrogenase cytochrome b subunit [Azospirillum brasilense]MDW7628306.1 Ni/Fe-hydrogenase cytochrome b subunit [Azospirillum brasilense]MDX5952245.1 Ni/Fe-hydrogenase cytochrome b subunit [Azospirillum brasilense]
MSSQAHEHQPLGGRVLTLPFLICAALVAIAGVILFQRYTQGLAAASNLNDGYPWGIWVAIDVVIGSAFGCAGYVIALLCYILNRGEYHPLVRPAVLASLFGYGLAGLAVLVDLGRYWNFYHMMLPWYAQPNSVMLEVGLCVATYTLVLVVEFAPAFLERFGIEGLRAKLNKVLWVFIALGVLLPTMHQSSLGTMMVIVGHKLSPLWQSQMLPVFFLLTAILMGFAIVVWESVMASLNFRRPMETPVLSKLSGLMLVVASLFVVLRFVDLIVRGQIGQIFGGPQSGWFVAEMALMISGLALLIPKANRNRSRALFLSASLLLAAGILYRLNVYLIGFTPAVGPWHYFPSVKEIMVTVGVFALEIALYLLFVKKLPVMHAVHPEHG